MNSNRKGFTLIESLFAFSVFISVIILLVSLYTLNGKIMLRIEKEYQEYISIQSNQEQKLNLEEGLYVVEVTEYSSAEKAGLRSGDLIVKADGRRIKTFEELQEVKNSKKEGDSINIEFIRDGKTQNANVTLTPSQTVNN